MTAQTTPKIYVACLAAYNAGYLHGEWIDVDREADEICEEIRDMLSRSPVSDAEEWAIHDREGFFDIHLSEWEDIATVAQLGQAIARHGAAAAAYYQHFGKWDEDDFSDRYRGEYDSKTDFVANSFEETGQIEEIEKFIPSYYIDWEAIARDWFLSDYFEVKGDRGKILVFSHS